MRTPLLIGTSVALLITTVAVRAQQAPPANLIPVTAASLVAQPDRYVGLVVAVYGTVDAPLGATAFSMDQDPKRSAMNDVLVIAPNLTAHAKMGEYVTVVGEVMKFDLATLAAKAPHYVRMAKRLTGQSLDNSLADHLQLERHGIADSMATEDLRNGVGAFLAGERVEFHGR